MSKPVHRTKNTCRQCGSSWTPRSTAVSNMCPECGSQEIIAPAQLVRPRRRKWPVVALIAAVILVAGGGVAAFLLLSDREPQATRPTTAPTGQAPQAAPESPFKPGDA